MKNEERREKRSSGRRRDAHNSNQAEKARLVWTTPANDAHGQSVWGTAAETWQARRIPSFEAECPRCRAREADFFLLQRLHAPNWGACKRSSSIERYGFLTKFWSGVPPVSCTFLFWARFSAVFWTDQKPSDRNSGPRVSFLGALQCGFLDG